MVLQCVCIEPLLNSGAADIPSVLVQAATQKHNNAAKTERLPVTVRQSLCNGPTQQASEMGQRMSAEEESGCLCVRINMRVRMHARVCVRCMLMVDVQAWRANARGSPR